MTLPTAATINNLSRNPVATEYLPGGLVDQFIRKIVKVAYRHPGGQIFFNRKNTGPTPAAYSAGGTLTAAAYESTKQTISLQRIGAQLEIDIADALSSTDAGDQVELQVRALRCEILRKLGEQVIQGSGTPPNWSGFGATFTGAQLVGAGNGAANGAAPTVADIAKLLSLVTASDGSTGAGADCLVGSPKSERFVANLLATAGETPMYVWDRDLEVKVLHFRGKPLYIGQVPENETKGAGSNLSSIYAVKLYGMTGVRIVYSALGGVADENGIMAYVIPDQLGIGKRGAGALVYGNLMYPEVASGARLDGCDYSGLI